MILLVHILAGGLGLLSGYVALYATKGRTLHRKSGVLFVYTVLPMAITGLFISIFEGVAPAINIPFALLAIYLVISGLRIVRNPQGVDRASRLRRHSWRMSLALLVAALAFFAPPTRAPAPGLVRALPVLAVLVTMLYWLWRLRVRRAHRGGAGASAPQSTAIAEVS